MRVPGPAIVPARRRSPRPCPPSLPRPQRPCPCATASGRISSAATASSHAVAEGGVRRARAAVGHAAGVPSLRQQRLPGRPSSSRGRSSPCSTSTTTDQRVAISAHSLVRHRQKIEMRDDAGEEVEACRLPCHDGLPDPGFLRCTWCATPGGRGSPVRSRPASQAAPSGYREKPALLHGDGR